MVALLQCPITGLAFVDDATGGGGNVLPEPDTSLLMIGGFGLTGAPARKSGGVAPAAGQARTTRSTAPSAAPRPPC